MKTSLGNGAGDISPELHQVLTLGIQGTVQSAGRKLLDMEESEEYIAYTQLLKMLHVQGDIDSLMQETGLLYDKIFYVAESIREVDGVIEVQVGPSSFVRLNEKIPASNLPTIADYRNSICEGVLFSGVGALQIQTNNGLRIPLLQRDSGAPTDAGKYTLPAGRADKTPGLTAYEEVLEEIVLFGRQDGKLKLIVPFLAGGGISEEKAKQLVSIARGHYIASLLKNNNYLSIGKLNTILAAEFVVVPLSLREGGKNVRTVFKDSFNQSSHEVIESGIYPLHDTLVNTYEMIRAFSLDLRDFHDVFVGDGDGFGRNTRLFTLDEIRAMDTEKDIVASLRGAVNFGIFGEPQKSE